MKTNLKEFNYQNHIIRAIICNPSNSTKKLYLMIPGFGRSAVSEKKFKKLSDLLVTNNFSTLRIDFLENINKDYSQYLQEVGKDIVLMIHGFKDEAVPYESQLFKPKNLILVEKGDHDLERPDLFRIWIENAMIF